MCICFFNSTTTATSLMIVNYSLKSESDHVQIMWSSPQYRPEKYEFTYLCITNSTCLRRSCHKPIVASIRILKLGSDSTFIRIQDISPNSTCVMKLVAVFNPASIDSGIVFTAKTSAATTGNWRFVWEFNTYYVFQL